MSKLYPTIGRSKSLKLFLYKKKHLYMYVCKKYNNNFALFVKFQPKMKAFWIFFWQDWQNQVHHNTSSPLSRSSQLINSKLFSSKYSNSELCSCLQCVHVFNVFIDLLIDFLLGRSRIHQICQIYIFILDGYMTIKIWDSCKCSRKLSLAEGRF